MEKKSNSFLEEINNIIKSNEINNNNLIEINNQIDNIINDIENRNEITKIINNLNNIKKINNDIINNNKKNNNKISSTKNNLNELYNKHNYTDRKLIKPYDGLLSKKNWVDILDNNLLINNALCGASIIEQNGMLWTGTDNVKLSKEEFGKIKNIFSEDYINNETIIKISGLEFDIDKKENTSIYLSRFDGGGMICQTNHAFIIGIYSNNEKYEHNGHFLNQNKDLCNHLVKQLCNSLKEKGY